MERTSFYLMRIIAMDFLIKGNTWDGMVGVFYYSPFPFPPLKNLCLLPLFLLVFFFIAYSSHISLYPSLSPDALTLSSFLSLSRSSCSTKSYSYKFDQHINHRLQFHWHNMDLENFLGFSLYVHDGDYRLSSNIWKQCLQLRLMMTLKFSYQTKKKKEKKTDPMTRPASVLVTAKSIIMEIT